MAGTYKYGFPEKEPILSAKEKVLEKLRAPVSQGGADDQDPIIIQPHVVQSPEHADNGEYLVRVVTGKEGSE